jgi:SSS family solute:Na+ symporter
VDMNFLHYSILMFVICCLVLIGVSLMTSAPERKKLAGLTFATVDEKMEVTPVRALDHKPAAETAFEHRLNVVFSLALIATVVGLWFHFR